MKHPTPRGQKNWSLEDTQKLKDLAGTISKEEIAIILNTTVDRVVNKAASQGFKLKVNNHEQ